MTAFNPNLLPESADPEGSTRFENVNMMHLLIPCREEGTLFQWYEKDNMFVIYDCSPEYGGQAIESFKGTLLIEADGSYSWWRQLREG